MVMEMMMLFSFPHCLIDGTFIDEVFMTPLMISNKTLGVLRGY